MWEAAPPGLCKGSGNATFEGDAINVSDFGGANSQQASWTQAGINGCACSGSNGGCGGHMSNGGSESGFAQGGVANR